MTPATPPAAPCLFLDPETLRATGALALRRGPEGWRVTSAREVSGDRLWTQWPDAGPTRREDQYVRINPTSLP